MSEPQIQNVSDTAFLVATYRAIESQRADALFRDPLAETLSGAHGRAIVASVPRNLSFFGQWLVVIRTHIIDDFIQTALAQGVDTIINLGAGLDTRPYRMELPATLHWVEVDFPHMIDLKEERLKDKTPRCQLQRIKLDLADTSQRRALLDNLAAKTSKALVLTEGVIPYLEATAVATLAEDLKARPAFAYFVADYLSPEALRYRQKVGKRMGMQNAPFRFEPGDYFAFFQEHGWKVKEIRYVGEEATKLKRPPRLPLAMRILVTITGLFGPAKRRAAFLKSAAYVLFEPAV